MINSKIKSKIVGTNYKAIAILIMLNLIPHFPYFGYRVVMLLHSITFYIIFFCLMHKNYISIRAAIALGYLFDIINGGIIGVSALEYLIMYAIIEKLRSIINIEGGFYNSFATYFLVVVTTQCVKYVVMFLYSVSPTAVQFTENFLLLLMVFFVTYFKIAIIGVTRLNSK